MNSFVRTFGQDEAIHLAIKFQCDLVHILDLKFNSCSLNDHVNDVVETLSKDYPENSNNRIYLFYHRDNILTMLDPIEGNYGMLPSFPRIADEQFLSYINEVETHPLCLSHND